MFFAEMVDTFEIRVPKRPGMRDSLQSTIACLFVFPKGQSECYETSTHLVFRVSQSVLSPDG